MKAYRILLAILLALGCWANAGAVCNQSGASQADRDLWNDHGCWTDFFLWQYQAYNMNGSDWSGRGWNDACNVNLEYPKHWNAAYLVTYGLIDNYYQSWHGTIDYRQTAEAGGNSYHDRLKHVATDDTSIFGSFTPGFWPWDTDQVATSCLLYNPTATNSHPAARAGDFMHEGWHAWLKKYNWDNGSFGGHRAAQGNCTVANFCDYFYFHGVSAYAFGEMWKTDGTARYFHSPNQVQVEFLCDVSDFPQPWVPNSVRLGAQADANQRSTQRFINGPGYFCGNPRPW